MYIGKEKSHIRFPMEQRHSNESNRSLVVAICECIVGGKPIEPEKIVLINAMQSMFVIRSFEPRSHTIMSV